MLRRAFLLIALLLAPIVAVPAWAHQQKIAISTVSINPRTDRLELVHQVPVHDAEHALRVQGTKVPDIVGSADSREAFVRYAARRFLLEMDGAPITPTYVGSEVIGGSLFVYQEAPAPQLDAQIRVNSQILTDVWARQENRVNIGSGTKVTTFVFTAGDAAQSARLSR
ncbi:MAG: hypothetical protein CVT75_02715 [Alphaproteobacteria bacterium HGW-Alphaproteobacteria-14]|nr:MAG: hypothetical protein CVT75_02715 [Alphaproteobacteria bacterium HGW-Alphaproteobacteria-14]